jgi:hypothetical protein
MEQTPSTSSQGGLPAFQASHKWTGRKEGYAYKLGEQGLGYYLDTPPKQPSSTSGMDKKPKPVLAKSSSIVKGIKPQGGVSKQQKKPGWLLGFSFHSCSAANRAASPYHVSPSCSMLMGS